METVSLKDFFEMLEKHDWFWIFADDSSAYRAGQEAESKLNHLAGASSTHRAMLSQYHDHIWSGPSWNNEKQPKPAKPE